MQKTGINDFIGKKWHQLSKEGPISAFSILTFYDLIKTFDAVLEDSISAYRVPPMTRGEESQR